MKLAYFSTSLLMLCLLLAGCGGSSGGNSQPKPVLPPPQANLSDTLDTYLNTNQPEDAPGLSVLVRKDGQVVYKKSKGLANSFTGAQINNNTGFRLGSVTKPFVALAIMQLEERGFLNLEDRLAQYIPGISEVYGDITLFQLLTHQSGIPDYVNDTDNLMPLDNLTTEQFINLGITTGESELEFSPGSQAQYSNTGYVALTAVIEHVTGLSFVDYMQLEIFDYLGMNNSYVINENRQMGDLGEDAALSHARTKKVYAIGFENQEFNALIYGSSGQVSSIEDMNAFLIGLANEEIVSRQTLDKMLVPQSPLNDIGDYGLGWLLGTGNYWHNDRYTSKSDYWHSGGYGGYRTLLSISPQHGIEVVVLTNGGNITQEHTWNILELVRQHYL